MRFSVTFEQNNASPSTTEPVTVGWFLADQKTGIIYDPPERVRTVSQNRSHAKAASRCPAVINLESRYFMVRCPFDIHVGFGRTKDGKPVLKNLAGNSSAIRAQKLGEKVRMTAESEWRLEGVPTIQLVLPYVFLADEPVYASQISPFMHYSKDPLPGTIFGGRFPINVWPRQLMWAFEWHDTQKPIKLRRGDPLFYMVFETLPQNRSISLKEAEVTEDLQAYMELISGAVNYVNQTFSLFQAAEERRPTKLLKLRDRNG